jgi:hypothetical protein
MTEEKKEKKGKNPQTNQAPPRWGGAEKQSSTRF